MVIFSVSGGFGLRSWTFGGILSPSAYHLYGWYMDDSALCARGRARWNLMDCGASSPRPRSGPPLLQSFFSPVDTVGCVAVDRSCLIETQGFEQTAASS